MATSASTNPLLQDFKGYDNSIPFTSIKAEHFLPALDIAIEEAKQKLKAIETNPQSPTFENTILALENFSEKADMITSIFSNLEHANGDQQLHDLAKEIYPKKTAFMSDIMLNPILFQRVLTIYKDPNSKKLDSESQRLLEKTYIGFTRNGALLSEADKEKIRKIDQELSVLIPKFSENVLKATNAFEMVIDNKADLDGLPDTAIEAAAHLAEAKDKKGRWVFNLQAPSFIPFLTYAKNRLLREKLWRAYNSRSFNDSYDNQNVIKDIIQKRYERAQILGFKNHAHFVLAERMAKDPETVVEFLNKLLRASKSTAQKELQELRDFAKDFDSQSDLQPWDFGYYSEKLKEKKYSFNEEDLRPYFQLEKVIEGVFEHARKLYGLTFKENPKIETYHPEVKAYEIYEESNKRYMGLFYADFFPRETKKGGAWMTQFREQGYSFGNVRRPHVSIVCNFTKPTPTKPSLLSFDEVRTLFHEFGHALHGMLSECTYRSIAGTNVYWDFVELPSQIMENWATEKEGLDLFARHYQTNEPIPAQLLERLQRAQKFQAGWLSLRQLQFAILDMNWHTQNPAQITDVDSFEAQATSETRLLPKIPGMNSSCSFSHIFAGGYSAGYYSYKWAEVLDADAFEYFKEKGLFNKEVANNFKNFILSRGDSEHPMELYKKFRGREPDPNALLRRDGLI